MIEHSAESLGERAAMPALPDGDRLGLVTRVVAGAARAGLSSLARITLEGLDRPLPRSGPLIVVANHLSNADPPFVGGWVTPVLGRRMRFVAKEALFVGPVGVFLRSQGVMPVRTGGSDPSAYRFARAALERGEVMCIFPEGTRSSTGTLGDPKPGVALLATRSGVPILPVGVSGTDRFWPRGAPLPRIGTRITLRVGEPFHLAARGRGRAALEDANEELMRRIAALVDPRHRGRYEPWRSAG